MMAGGKAACPANAFRYNGTLCACDPGLFFSANGSCVGFDAPPGVALVSAGEEESQTFLSTVLPLDSIKRLTQSQAVLLEATLAALVLWLGFCVAVRFGKLKGGRSVWFRLRWWISRLDFYFNTKHWLEDRKVVVKRKTELGGAFSVASWILFIGLLSALLYQAITKRSIEVYRVRPANAPDLLSFINDMEFNITTISSMSCSHLRGLDTLVTGVPGFIDYRVFPLSTYANYSCHNTSRGPVVSLRCNNCQIPRRDHYISWHFVDLANDPAIAVGFDFNLRAKNHGDDRHVSSVSGTAKLVMNNQPATFRGSDLNILKIHLYPQIYSNMNNLKIIQPLVYDFIPGSSSSDAHALQASLQSWKDGLINTTLHISYLSDYIVEIDRENLNGPVSFLADVGGLYCISVAIFFYLLWQCEARVPKLRCEDTIMHDIRSKKHAQRHWDKVRKFVMYTWGPSNLDASIGSIKRHGDVMSDSFCGIRPLHKNKLHSKTKSTLDKAVGSSNPVVPSEALKTGSVSNTTCSDSSHLEVEEAVLDIKEEASKEQQDVHCLKDAP